LKKKSPFISNEAYNYPDNTKFLIFETEYYYYSEKSGGTHKALVIAGFMLEK
jgi:hypothetical protein